MPQLQRIIAATDLSPLSLDAVDRGFELASHSGAHYTLVHALGLDALGPLRNLLGDQAGVLSQNRRNFRHPSSSPATSASRSIILPSLWKV